MELHKWKKKKQKPEFLQLYGLEHIPHKEQKRESDHQAKGPDFQTTEATVCIHCMFLSKLKSYLQLLKNVQSSLQTWVWVLVIINIQAIRNESCIYIGLYRSIHRALNEQAEKSKRYTK